MASTLTDNVRRCTNDTGYATYAEREVPKASAISVSDRALEDAGALEMAVRHAFWEACELLRRDGALMPFTVVCTPSGMEMADRPAASSDEVYEGVKTLLARVAPEAYVLCYDGSIDVDGRHTDAVVCEAARRGDSEASLLALPYTIGENGYVFDDAYACRIDTTESGVLTSGWHLHSQIT